MYRVTNSGFALDTRLIASRRDAIKYRNELVAQGHAPIVWEREYADRWRVAKIEQWLEWLEHAHSGGWV